MSTSPAQPSSFVKDYVDTTAPVGTFLTGFRFYVSIFIFLILLGFAIHLFFFRARDNHHTASINATVIKSICSQYDSKDKNKNCDLTLEYMVGSNKYQTPFHSNSEYLVGQTISIYYDPNNPNDISDDSPTTDKIGAGILLGVGLLIVAGAYFSYWLSQKYPVYASFETTAAGASMFSNALGRS